MSPNTALDLVEEVPQLHEDNQARHGQPDVTKELEYKYKSNRSVKLNKDMCGFVTLKTPNISSASYKHMDVVHEVQKQHRELHDEVRVVDIRPLTLPGPWVVQVPQMDGVSEGTRTALYDHETQGLLQTDSV